MILTETRLQKFNLVQEWLESGISQKAFAITHGIKPETFYRWKNRFVNFVDKKPDFIQLLEPSPPPREIILKYPSGVELILPIDFPIETIKSLSKI